MKRSSKIYVISIVFPFVKKPMSKYTNSIKVSNQINAPNSYFGLLFLLVNLFSTVLDLKLSFCMQLNDFS